MDQRIKLIKWLLVAWAMALALEGHAQETNIYFRAGSGFTNNVKSSTYSMGLDRFFDREFFYRIDGGFWSDTQPGHSGAVYGSIMGGCRVGDLNAFHAELTIGPLFHSAPDRLLGSAFQITEELTFGYQNVSFGIKHISNAGIVKPNYSRDTAFFQYTIPIWY